MGIEALDTVFSLAEYTRSLFSTRIHVCEDVSSPTQAGRALTDSDL